MLGGATKRRSAFPWSGGKAGISENVWRVFGGCSLYAEPFFGAGSVYFAKPPNVLLSYALLNDADGSVMNFWRSVQNALPVVVMHLSRLPFSEIDARAYSATYADLVDRLVSDLYYCDPLLAAQWYIGHCVTVQSNFRALGELRGRLRKPEELVLFANILRKAHLFCGDYKRVLQRVISIRSGQKAVFLDPPYAGTRQDMYNGSVDLTELISWAERHKDDFQIAYCCHYGDAAPLGFRQILVRRRNRREAYGGRTESIWFSPNCDVSKW